MQLDCLVGRDCLVCAICGAKIESSIPAMREHFKQAHPKADAMQFDVPRDAKQTKKNKVDKQNQR